MGAPADRPSDRDAPRPRCHGDSPSDVHSHPGKTDPYVHSGTGGDSDDAEFSYCDSYAESGFVRDPMRMSPER